MALGVLVALVVVLFTTIGYYYLTFKDAVRKSRARNLRGPEPQWIFGNLKNSGMASRQVALHQVLAELKQTYGDICSFWLGPYHTVVLSRVEDVQYVLANRQIYDISALVTSSFGILFPKGLVALRGDTWKRHARFMLPTFKRAKVLPYLDTIVSCVDRFIEEQLVHRDGQIHTDLISQCQHTLLNIIAFIAFDYDLEASTDAESRNLRKAFNDFVHYGNRFLILTGIPRWTAKLLLLLSARFQQALRTMRHYVLSIIVKEQERQRNESKSSVRAKNLIASLVSSIKAESSSSKAFLTPQEVFDEVSMSILAGFETTSTVLAWFIFFMSKHPEVQTKMKDELREHRITSDTPLTQGVLDSLRYLDCVVKEVLRFAPTVSSIARDATCDDTINGIPIKQGDTILIAINNLHRDPRYWKVDPAQFLPERFFDDDRNPPAYAFMPFGGGHRACAGQDLALFELKIAMARLMQRVTFEDPGAEANNSGGYVQRISCFPEHLAVRVRIESSRTSD